MEAWQSTSMGSSMCRRRVMPNSATPPDWKALLSHLLVLARVCTTFSFYFTIYKGIPSWGQQPCLLCLLGLTLPSHTLLSMLRTWSLKIPKMPEWDKHFSLARSPAPANFYFFSLGLWHRREKLPERFAVNLQKVFIRLETTTQISSTAQQCGGTEGTFSTWQTARTFIYTVGAYTCSRTPLHTIPFNFTHLLQM